MGSLVQFHLADRYRPDGWRELLAEARAAFAATTFSDHWAEALRG